MFTATALANSPPTAVIGNPSQDTTVTLGDAVSFQGTASDADGTIASNTWTFGDGNGASVEDPGNYTYATVGTYTVTYQVTDNDGASSTPGTVVVTVAAAPPPNQPPTATIANPSQDTTVTLGDAVNFQGTASDADGTIASNTWTFGDGNGASVEDPGNYTYAAVGTYTVTYQVTDNDGASSTPGTVVVTVAAAPPPNQPPTATVDNPSQDTTVTGGDAVNFQGTASDADGTIASHAWDFGDGNGASVEDPGNHTYAAVGTYTVTYQVTDNDGASSTPDTVVITVQAASTTNYALRFFGNGVSDIDRVKIRIDDPATVVPGPPVDVGATDFTIEFWMRGTAAENGSGAVSCGNNLNWIFGNIIIDRDRFFQDRKYGISMAGGQIVFGVSGDGTGDLTICGTSRVDDGVWHHIAMTRERSSGALQLFVDGVREASVATGPGGDISYPDDGVPNSACNGLPCTNSDPFVVIAAEKHDDDPLSFPSFSGFMDEIRYSNIIRYTGNFTRPSGRFLTDVNTVGLYHFDEGAGDVVGDSSGATGGPSDGVRRLGGTPAGPQWVLSDAPTGS